MVNARLKHFFFLFIAAFCALSAVSAMASLQAHVDRNPVAVDESFNLFLQLDDGADGSDPDLHGLMQDFDILGQSKSSSIQINNGKSTRSTQWQISLAPKHSGQVVIPAISAGNQSSQPITLNVTAPSQAAATQQDENLFLDVSAESHAVYVQQQIIFTVRLYRAIDLGNGSTLSDPTFPDMDAVVQRLDEDHEFQTVRNGKSYAVIERRYAVYPQKSGSFNSAPIVFDGNIIEANQGGGIFSFDPFNQRARHVRLRSKTVSFSVKPIPASFTGNQWLPASKLSLAEQWSENPPKFTVGEPITRTVTLSANGLTASQLPALDANAVEGFKLYPDQPVLNDGKDSSGITGVRQQKFAIIPTRAGSLTLPEMTVKWWNTATDREEQTRLPARTVTVSPGAQGSNINPPLPTAPQNTEAPATSVEPIGKPLSVSMSSAFNSAGWWPWLSLVLALGWLATLLAWWWQRGNSSQPANQPSGEASLAQLESQLKKSCLINDATQTKSQLLAWARQRWPDNPPNSLIALARRCEPGLADALRELDKALYAKEGAVWQGEVLWQLFSDSKPAVKASLEQEEVLEPLYRS